MTPISHPTAASPSPAMLALIALMAIAGAIGFAPAALAQETLSGDQIRRLIAGRSASWVTGDGRWSGEITYLRNGSLISKVQVFGAPREIQGTWSIRGDRFCRTIRLDPTPTKCQTVQRASGSSYRFINEGGGVATVTTFR